ncbi:hypothetical protein OV208_16345 [Corallococcus sp. bb12-1]|uniref:hypothetical protein n=1 Tax=Corallococcus sp. bb12-1 TaxID=2996784 RepID=UPI0022716E8B|nr:hypothetical protein [Corallococcus sp. bb12-1]MCY1042891.1 hypothetical protein [Corallococcus sp. bb12-1]
MKALGNTLDGRAQGMVLNFTFANWGQSCASTLKYCIDAIMAPSRARTSHDSP